MPKDASLSSRIADIISRDLFKPITRFVYHKFGTRILHIERPYSDIASNNSLSLLSSQKFLRSCLFRLLEFLTMQLRLWIDLTVEIMNRPYGLKFGNPLINVAFWRVVVEVKLYSKISLQILYTISMPQKWHKKPQKWHKLFILHS